MPCQIFLCRALMIRAMPNISVPCRAWYQDLGTRILVPRSWYQDLRRAREAEPLRMQEGTGGCKPLASVPCRAWYQDLGTKILVPRSWYQDLGTKKKESLRGGASQKSARGRGGLQAPRQGVWGAGSPPVRTILWTQSQDFGTRIYREHIVNLIIVHLS